MLLLSDSRLLMNNRGAVKLVLNISKSNSSNNPLNNIQYSDQETTYEWHIDHLLAIYCQIPARILTYHIGGHYSSGFLIRGSLAAKRLGLVPYGFMIPDRALILAIFSFFVVRFCA